MKEPRLPLSPQVGLWMACATPIAAAGGAATASALELSLDGFDLTAAASLAIYVALASLAIWLARAFCRKVTFVPMAPRMFALGQFVLLTGSNIRTHHDAEPRSILAWMALAAMAAGLATVAASGFVVWRSIERSLRERTGNPIL